MNNNSIIIQKRDCVSTKKKTRQNIYILHFIKCRDKNSQSMHLKIRQFNKKNAKLIILMKNHGFVWGSRASKPFISFFFSHPLIS